MADDRKPTFGELRDAMMPPGADKEALWSALKGAQQTGGFAPGGVVPDISMSPGGNGRPGLGGQGGGGSSFRLLPCMACRTFHEPGEPCAKVPPASPPDPFPPGAAPAAALHEMFTDFLAAGFTEDQATAILGKMLAAYGRES
jgi:hypothetical protein